MFFASFSRWSYLSFLFSSFDFSENMSSLCCANEWGVVEVKNTSKKKFDKNFSVDFQCVAVKPISTNDLDIVDNSIDILAAYDISILDNRYSKWQPNQDGVNVEVCLAEKIADAHWHCCSFAWAEDKTRIIYL